MKLPADPSDFSAGSDLRLLWERIQERSQNAARIRDQLDEWRGQLDAAQYVLRQARPGVDYGQLAAAREEAAVMERAVNEQAARLLKENDARNTAQREYDRRRARYDRLRSWLLGETDRPVTLHDHPDQRALTDEEILSEITATIGFSEWEDE